MLLAGLSGGVSLALGRLLSPEAMVFLIVCAVFGAVCSFIANKKGRSTSTWFVLGFLF